MSSRASGGLLGVEASDDLRAVRSALKNMPEDMAQRTFSASRQQLSAGWIQELGKSAPFSAQQRSIVAANPQIIAHSFGLSVKTGGSGPLGHLTRAFEFGTLDRDEFNTYSRRSKSGASHAVRRRTKRQIPTRSQTGWIAYPAAGRWGKRAFAMYMQIIVKTAHDAVEAAKR